MGCEGNEENVSEMGEDDSEAPEKSWSTSVSCFMRRFFPSLAF